MHGNTKVKYKIVPVRSVKTSGQKWKFSFTLSFSRYCRLIVTWIRDIEWRAVLWRDRQFRVACSYSVGKFWHIALHARWRDAALFGSKFVCGWTAIFMLRVLGIESQQKGLRVTYFCGVDPKRKSAHRNEVHLTSWNDKCELHLRCFFWLLKEKC